MIERIAEAISPALENSIIRQIRRNHGLEHATVHILSGNIQNLRMAGRSSNNGFMLVGDVPTEKVESAANDALKRLQNGEHKLAVHPHCGTNLATTGFMTTLVGLVGFGWNGKRLSFDRLSWIVLMMTLAVIFSRPLGTDIQRHITTKGDIGDLEIVKVNRRQIRWWFGREPIIIHNITTRNG
jgi:hypothetical protein